MTFLLYRNIFPYIHPITAITNLNSKTYKVLEMGSSLYIKLKHFFLWKSKTLKKKKKEFSEPSSELQFKAKTTTCSMTRNFTSAKPLHSYASCFSKIHVRLRDNFTIFCIKFQIRKLLACKCLPQYWDGGHLHLNLTRWQALCWVIHN